MDRRYFKVLEELQECSTLATYMAMNANYDRKYDDCLKSALDDILQQVHSCQQMLFRATRLQTQGEPWIREVCGTRQS